MYPGTQRDLKVLSNQWYFWTILEDHYFLKTNKQSLDYHPKFALLFRCYKLGTITIKGSIKITIFVAPLIFLNIFIVSQLEFIVRVSKLLDEPQSLPRLFWSHQRPLLQQLRCPLLNQTNTSMSASPSVRASIVPLPSISAKSPSVAMRDSISTDSV